MKIYSLFLIFALWVASSTEAEAAKIVYAVTSGTLSQSTDSGQTWQAMSKPVGASFYQLILDPTNPSVLYAVGYDNGKAAGAFWGSRDAGVTWSESLVGASIGVARIQIAI